MASTDSKITVSVTDIDLVKDIIEAAVKVVTFRDRYGYGDERVDGAIHSLDSALGDIVSAD